MYSKIEMAIAAQRRGESFDMDRALQDLMKGEQFRAKVGNRLRLVEVLRVTNAGFRGQEIFVKIVAPKIGETKIYYHIAVGDLPRLFVDEMITKFNEQKKS